MEDPITERINLLVKERADKPSDFAKATGLTSQNVYDLTTGRKGAPSYASLKKILIAFPNVSERWLMLGEGGMLKNVQDSGTPNQHAHDCPPTDHQVGKEIEHGGHAVFEFELKPSGKKARVEMPGTDLVRQVADNTAEIKKLRQEFAQLQERFS